MNIVCQLLTSSVELFSSVKIPYMLHTDLGYNMTKFDSCQTMAKTHFYPRFVSIYVILQA